MIAYLLGELSGTAAREMEQYAVAHPAFAASLEDLRVALTADLQTIKRQPPTSAKSKLFGRPEILDDAVGREFPPYINAHSKIDDFMPWMSEAMVTLADNTADFECLPIGASEDTFSFLAKMCSSIPEEVHCTELERVMLVQGACDFIVGGEVHHFGPGDQYNIPLYTPHSAHVTGDEPCIFIVQRTVLAPDSRG